MSNAAVRADATTSPGRDVDPHHHAVEFYDDDAMLCEHVARYLADGLAAGEPVIVISTAAHRAALEARLASAGHDVAAAIARDQLALLDAEATLALFMIDGKPARAPFFEHIGGAVDRLRAASPGAKVRAFGEMVDILWRGGNRGAALALEQLWNELATTRAFSLLCAYVMGNFYKAADGDGFDAVCNLHSHVVGPGGSTRDHAQLQQRARALEHEVEQRKQLESALREALARETAARAEAERMLRFNELFAGMLGHDLRNPLSTISIGASHIARSSDNERTTRSASRIVASATRMARMVDQLLDLTNLRITDGFALVRKPLDLGELWREIVEQLREAHATTPIMLESVGDLMGHWDRDRLAQAASNVAHNAIVHGTPGQRVTITVDGGDTAAVIATVHNAGAVPREILPVMFAPFRGASHKRPNARGLGLGLYLTQQIVAGHGGAIEVSSDPDDGTTVRMSLPRQSAMP